MRLPRLRPAFRFALYGLALAVLVTFLVTGPYAPFVLWGLAPYIAPGVGAGLVFAAAAGHWLERRGLAGRGWAGALLGLATLSVAAVACGLHAWFVDGLGAPTRYVVGPLWVALVFGGAPSLLLGVLYARGRKDRTAVSPKA